MNVFETAFWKIKSLAKPAAEQPAPPPPVEESHTEFISRTADLTPGHGHYNKGMILERRGDKVNAIAAYREAIRAVPQYYDAHANVTRLLCELEKWDDAIQHGEMAVRLKRNSPRVHNNLSVAFYNKREISKALYHCVAAMRLAPDDLDLFENLTQIRKAHPELENSEIVAEAKEVCTRLAENRYEQGFLLLKERKIQEAVDMWKMAIRLAPHWAEPMCNLAAILATHPDNSVRKAHEALDLATKAMQLGDRSHRYYDALAAAFANAGRFNDARRTIEQILPTLKTKGPLEAAERLSDRLKLYTERTPLRQELPLFRPPARPK